MLAERILAAITLTVCVLLFARLLLGDRRRARLDAALRLAAAATRHVFVSLRHRREAARAADEAIERARRRVDREGNVYTPESFKKPPRDKMH